MLTQQLLIPGTRMVNLSIKIHRLSSVPSSPLTLDSITVKLRTSWGGGDLDPSLLM
ncbi:hypothetical protein EPR50_G00011600 [Perca flavescens]|uniref:Uncharacterized protein n=1 Tax=Perca flavescens TaxID=8167 RepID=A0A484DKH6_PERFV|nr:hypothetical protein EPR50_G00011600 [Perca flavescens]